MKPITCPFEIVVDSREQQGYSFEGFTSGPPGRSSPLIVPTRREALPIGDYAVFGYPMGIIERKSKEDLYSSISQRRENFTGRLEKMCLSCDFAAVIVEAEWAELLSDPPKFTKFSPKSLARTIQAWMVRYQCVHWIMAPSRGHAEAFTFRLLERYWKDKKDLETTGRKWGIETLRYQESQLAQELAQEFASEEM